MSAPWSPTSRAWEEREDAVPDEEEAASAVLDALDSDVHNPALEVRRSHAGDLGGDLEVDEEPGAGQRDLGDGHPRVLLPKLAARWVIPAKQRGIKRLARSSIS